MHTLSSYKTAVLVFARSSKEEAVNKSIFRGEQLFDALTNHVLETVSKTQIPYFHFSEENQIGNDFGERFTNAIQEVFEKGYHQIITVGNDTPQLNASDILEAEKQLRTNTSVIGKSADGGFYLMGLHKSQFDKDTFQQLSWQTSKVSKQLLKLLSQRNTEIFQLPTLLDIDTQADVKLIVSYARQFSEKLLMALLNAISSQKREYLIPSQEFNSTILGVRHNKGSPMFLTL